ncbi:MAG: exodeoxyribonuclease VII small subunit [Anaerolineales bacterium]|nr:exodeoxyribonuclease VII small subunit [Anaerolineales bacterium]MCK4962605.1 exodeoxyribonuclease VII small subunit [Anaerolineales bacterium]
MARAKAVDKLNYEQAFRELETVVERLGTGDLPLEEALALFEKGQALATRCSELLEQAELKLRQLVPDESGGYVEIDLEGDEER